MCWIEHSGLGTQKGVGSLTVETELELLFMLSWRLIEGVANSTACLRTNFPSATQQRLDLIHQSIGSAMIAPAIPGALEIVLEASHRFARISSEKLDLASATTSRCYEQKLLCCSNVALIVPIER